MWLCNLRLPGQATGVDLRVEGGFIREVRERGKARETGEGAGFDGALVFPGLINSHDHLDFNLFPPMGNRVYPSYRDWGPDIHTNQAAAISAVLKVPQELRTAWGIYKNLLNGFTTVVNHGEKLPVDQPLIDVLQDCYCLHSVGFEKGWKWKLNYPLAGRRPFVLHVGEGTDALAGKEIDQLIRWNLFRRALIGIHGVAMNEKQAKAFKALVWCPASNYFLLGKTAPVGRLKDRVPIVFGTDSTLTASWNGWEQVRQGRKEPGVTDTDLFDMLTAAPAKAWGLEDRGEIAVGKVADLVIARPKEGMDGMDAFFGLDPEDLLLVMRQGRPLVIDRSIRGALGAAGGLDDLKRCGDKYIAGDLTALIREIRRYYPEVELPVMLTEKATIE
jgi:cytosine/adenosine deaminase-related metal-dependent hydrolase